MSKLELNSLSNSIMTQKQLIDSLTSHISLYHSHSLPSSSCSIHTSNNQRSSILKWFSSLSVHHRQAHLTVVDSNFVQTLIRMLGTLHNRGHGLFIILPDLPSGDNLPSVCFKKSLGLLSRVSKSNQAQRRIFEATMLFASREGERIDDCSCSVKNIDTITVSEDFVNNLDEFVEFMDGVSNCRFLRGEESELGSDWVELEWIKAKGYYSIEAFVANRLEVSMRLAWLNCNSGKKRGVKLKEKASAAGVAANVYWRKKGCVSWWENLDAATKRKIFVSVFGKAAKPLTNKILKGTSGALEDEIWLFNTGVQRRSNLRYSHTVSERKTVSALANDNEFGSSIIPASLSGKPASLTNAFNSLLVLQDIVMMLSLFLNSELDQGRIFFSTLSSICTISDFVLRKVRGFLMVISLGYTKLELISEESDKSLCNKSKGNVSSYSRKKKGRNRNSKRINADPGSCMDGLLHDTSIKSTDFKRANGEKVTVTDSKKLPDDPPKKDNCRESSSSKVEMDHAHILIAGKSLTAAKKSKKGKGKNKNSGSKDPVEDINCGISDIEASSSFISQSEASQSNVVSHDIIPCNISNDNSADKEILALKLTRCHTNEPIKENDAYQNIQEKIKIDSSASFPHKSQDCYHHFSTYMVENKMNSCLETLDCKDNQNMTPSTFLDRNDLINEDCGLEKYVSTNQPDGKTASPGSFALRKECVLAPEKESGKASYMGISSSSECLPSEWPSMATTYFSPVNAHLPAATDRLHLDVGHNWHNHFHQSFLPTVHHGRNSPADGGHNPIMSRRSPMSLDWPPMVRGACGLVPPVTYSYDPGLISSRHCTFAQGISPCSLQLHATADDERRYSGDFTDLPDLTSAHELADECDSHWISEDELEVHAVSGIDYNQYFGDGVMYWNPSDHPGTGFSRPPSLSSDDSSWAWREADMIRAVDDMVTFSSSYSTNGLTSPTASFCSPFDPIGPSQSLGYAIPGNEVPGKLLCSSSTMQDAAMEEETTVAMPDLTIDVEGKSGDSLPYPILRPIIIPNMSRDRPRSEFKGSHDHKSPCVPPSKREQPQVKRPPSPVVLCVPRAPRPPPPPPSPASDSRKQRGFPTVRSGSSSPRHWGMRGWFHDGANVEEACLRVDGAEVVWPSWRGNNLSTRSMIQPLPAALLQDRLIAISQLARDQEHPDVALPLQPPELQSCLSRRTSPSLMHTFLHEEIDSFCKQVYAENLARKPYITWAVKRVRRSLQVLWPRSRTNIFGSNATGLSLPTSDVDLVVCLPPVRNLEPIKEAGILEGRNGIKETCLQHAARYLVNQDWVKNDSLKTVENTAIPIIMLVVEVPSDLILSSACNASPKEEPPHIYGEQSTNVQSDLAVLEESALSKCSQTNNDIAKDSIPVRLDISFKSPSHTGLQTTELVKGLMEQFPAATPLALVLKQFLADRSLDQSYSGGLSSYCLILLIIRFLQHEHHLGRPINQNLGSLLMDFLYFFGNVFDPRQIRISVQGSGVYIKRERGCSIDPIHIDDPLYPTNNVGRNCFRIHQCIKAFSEAYSTLEKELASLSNDVESCSKPSYVFLRKIIPSIGLS